MRGLQRIVCTAFIVSGLLLPRPGLAQTSSTPPPSSLPAGSGEQVAAGEEQEKPTRSFFPALFHNLGDDLKHMPRRNSLYWLAGGGALAWAVHPEDGKINRRLLGSPTADKLFIPGKYIGSSTVILGAATATYLVGRYNDLPRARHLGMDIIEGTILAEGITRTAKAIIRCDRPVGPEGRRTAGFSFPSGHSTLTFTAATILQQHLGYKAGIPTYLAASYVAISRLHDNRHYASDVVMGAASGIIIGRSVTWHGRNFYASPMFVPGGVGVMASLGPQ